MGESNRRYERFPVNLKATLIRGRKSATGRVVDVSFTGLFFTTVEPPPLRDLVKIDLVLPTGGETRLLGMAVHVVRASLNSKRRPGVGVQLFGIGPDVRAEWDKFVASVRKAHLKAVEEDERPDPNHTGDLATLPTPHELVAEAKAAGHKLEESEPYEPSEVTTAPPEVLQLDPAPDDEAEAPPLGPPPDTKAARTPKCPPSRKTRRKRSCRFDRTSPPNRNRRPRPAQERRPGTEGDDERPELHRIGRHRRADYGARRRRVCRRAATSTTRSHFLQSADPDEPDPAVDDGPGDVAPGPSDAFDIDRLFEVAKPELRVHVGSPEEIEPLRRRQAAGEHLFFRTEVHMSPGTELQVRVSAAGG